MKAYDGINVICLYNAIRLLFHFAATDKCGWMHKIRSVHLHHFLLEYHQSAGFRLLLETAVFIG